MGQTYVPKAWDAGRSRTAAAARAGSWLGGRRVRGVEAVTSGGGRVRVQCDTVVVAWRTIHTPLFLRALPARPRLGRAGRNLAIHPATAVRAEFDEEIDMARGVPQSFYIDEFADERDHVRGRRRPAGLPGDVAVLLGRERHRELMLRFSGCRSSA